MPKQGPRPNSWVSGPDPVVHTKYRAWMQQRNQAQWRGETWQLSFDEWCGLWQDNWHQRGRAQDNYCMVRTDPEGAWTIDNVEVIQRQEHCIRHRARQCGLSQKEKLKQKGFKYD